LLGAKPTPKSTIPTVDVKAVVATKRASRESLVAQLRSTKPLISAPTTDVSARTRRFWFLAGFGRLWLASGWFWLGFELVWAGFGPVLVVFWQVLARSRRYLPRGAAMKPLHVQSKLAAEHRALTATKWTVLRHHDAVDVADDAGPLPATQVFVAWSMAYCSKSELCHQTL
jgi:hypothetical protein